MPKEIWNEGRVVGLSAYEIYVKQHVASGSDLPVASEREWLSSSLAMGNSLLLKCPVSPESIGPQDHYFASIEFPSESRLAAANTIVAQFFDGDAVLDSGSFWASRISDFGSAIANSESLHPSGDLDPIDVPSQPASDIDSDKKQALQNYMKIVDGVVINPGSWVDAASNPPYSDFHPNYSSNNAILRIHVKGNIDAEHRPWIIFTGFTIKNILAGVSGGDGSVDNLTSTEIADGEFLGPAIFPWAAKICFVVPNSYVRYLSNGSYVRTLANTPEASVEDSPIIDMRTTDPGTFYGTGYASRVSKFSSDTSDPRVSDIISSLVISGPGGSILTVYQKSDAYPPALYGTFADAEGDNYLNPLDVVAPGTIKMFNQASGADLKQYQDIFPGTTAMNKTSDGRIQLVDAAGNLINVADVSVGDIIYNTLDSSATVKANFVQITTGAKSVKALALGEGTNGSQYTISDNPSAISITSANSSDNLTWRALLTALANNKALDLLGNRLKSAKQSLVLNHSPSANQGPYLEFGPESDKLRLYISDVAPSTSGVPVGSIGIGWGLES